VKFYKTAIHTIFCSALLVASFANITQAQTFKNKKLEYLKTAFELTQNSFAYLAQCDNMEAKIIASPYFLINGQIIQRELAKAMAGQDQSPERVKKYKNQLQDLQLKLYKRAYAELEKEKCKSKTGRESKNFFEKMSAMTPSELKTSIANIK